MVVVCGITICGHACTFLKQRCGLTVWVVVGQRRGGVGVPVGEVVIVMVVGTRSAGIWALPVGRRMLWSVSRSVGGGY